MKKFIKYWLYTLAKILHYNVQPHLLMYSLYFLNKTPMIKKFVNFFDPNDIRKVTSYNPTERNIMLPNKKYNLLVNPRDHIGFQSFIKNEPFEMSMYNLVEQNKHLKGNIIIDIGANIGTASIPICAKYGYELIAIEPSKDNLKLLKKNISNNQIKAQLLMYALVDNSFKENHIKMFINKGNTGANSLIEKWNPSKDRNIKNSFELVAAKTFDKIVREIGLNVDDVLCVKIDVEGMEEEVLLGAKKFLIDNKAPIIMEYRNDILNKYAGKNMKVVVKTLKETGYKIFSLSNRGELGKFMESKFYENIIALKFEHPNFFNFKV